MHLAKSELFDRFTIISLKKERLPSFALLADQFELFRNEVNSILELEVEEIRIQAEYYLEELYKINGYIWDLEHELRSGLEYNMSLSEIGSRAIQIRNLNGMRMRVKNKICKLFNETIFEEVKVDHISENLTEMSSHKL